MSGNKIAPRIQDGWKKWSDKLWLVQAASTFCVLKENLRVARPRGLKTLIQASVHFFVPNMEDEELPKEGTRNLREMK